MDLKGDKQYVLTVLDFKDGVFTIMYDNSYYKWTLEDVAANGYEPPQLFAALKDIGWVEQEGIEKLNGYVPLKDICWTAGKKSHDVENNDDMACKFFLSLMKEEKFYKIYKSGNTRGLWVKLSEEMTTAGFNLGPKPKEKLNNKFNALLTAVRKHRAESGRTGMGCPTPPAYIDDIIEIEGDSHSISPPVIVDSLDSPKPAVETSEKKNPFQNVSEKRAGSVASSSKDFKQSESKSPFWKSGGKRANSVASSSSSITTSSSAFEIFDCEASGGEESEERKKSVLPNQKKTRYSVRKESLEFIEKAEERQEERSRASAEHKEFIVKYLDKQEKEREEDRMYRRERDKKTDCMNEKFLDLFGKFVSRKSNRDTSDSGSDENLTPKRNRNYKRGRNTE